MIICLKIIGYYQRYNGYLDSLHPFIVASFSRRYKGKGIELPGRYGLIDPNIGLIL